MRGSDVVAIVGMGDHDRAVDGVFRPATYAPQACASGNADRMMSDFAITSMMR